MRTRMDLIFGKEGQKYFFSLALMIRKLNENGFWYKDKQRLSPVFLWSVLSRRRFFIVFFFVFIHYPSLNKLWKTFIKVVKRFRFAFVQGVGNIPPRKKKTADPRGYAPGGHGYKSNWTMHKPFISPGAPNDFLAIIERVWVGYAEFCKIIESLKTSQSRY